MKKRSLEQRLDKFKNLPPTLSLVGRVKSWIESPKNRYPVSCTVLSVEDTMEGHNSIEASWLYVSKALRYASGVALDLSKLRPKNSRSGQSGTASGPSSFASIYSQINETLRRGGEYKNGAVVLYLDIAHPDIEEFLKLDRSQIPWAKRALYISDSGELNDPSNLQNHPLRDLIISKVNDGSIWLAKKRWEDPETKLIVNTAPDPQNPYLYRVYSQVCTEVLLPSNGTCMLLPVNLGQCTLKNIRKSYRLGMQTLTDLHKLTGVGKNDYYLAAKVDKQVGLGAIGLGNLLARYSVKYKEFTEALNRAVTMYESLAYLHDVDDYRFTRYSAAVADWKSPAEKLAVALVLGHHDASLIARKAKMVRAFAIAPTATVSYKSVDLNGYTTTPEISPPLCHPLTKKVTRVSAEFGSVDYTYPPEVEVAGVDVSFDDYFELADTWQRLMNIQGLAHAISFNVWDCDINAFLAKWLDSNLVSTYYRLNVEQGYLDKSSVINALDSEGQEQLTLDFDFTPVEDVEDDGDEYVFVLKEPEDPGFCPVCAA